jgi:N-acetylmuramoyl-L-alanine amidase
MRVDELFPPEVIDEDIRKWMGGAALAGALALSPTQAGHVGRDHIPSGPSANDITTLAQTMWGEARNHGPLGMLAVGFVIKNRAASDDAAQHHFKFGGHNVADVAMKPKQFSCWNASDPNHGEMDQMKEIDKYIKAKKAPPGEKSFDDWFAKFKNTSAFTDYQAWRKAFSLASDILTGKAKDPTNGAVFYHTTQVHPKWADDMKPSSRVANHLFYRLPSPQKT